MYKKLPYEIEMFLKAGADPDLADSQGNAPLHRSTSHQITKLLLKYGANINQKNIWGFTPLMYAIDLGNKQIVKMLIKAGAKLDEKNCYDNTAIQYARNKGHTEIVQMLKNAGAQG